MAGGALAGLLAHLGLEEASAACVKPGKSGCKGPRDKECCQGATCKGGTKAKAGKCVCRGNLRQCGTACVNTQTDKRHCGACPTRCAKDETCQAGRCAPDCAPEDRDTTCAGKACGQVANNCGDEVNCGDCRGDQVCREGVCDCPGGTAACGGACVDLQADRAHCGTCDAACHNGQICQGGTCENCGMYQKRCDNRCIHFNHCCDDDCPGTAVCLPDGTCCGETVCDGECVSTRDDLRHCRGCGNACPAGSTRCCPEGCVNSRTDPTNCGLCGTVCPANTACQEGECVATCKAVRRACAAASDCCQDDGPMLCASNLHNPPSACSSSFGTKCCRPRGGACADDCDCCGDFKCTGGFCACPADWKPCKGACIPPDDCCDDGDCDRGHICRSDGVCVCPAGTRTCNGGCIPTSNCCGGADCGAGYLCRSGACVCQDGTKECGGVCIPNDACCTDGDCIGDPPCPPGYINCDNHCHEDGTCRLCQRGKRWECNTYKPTCGDELQTHCTCLEPDQYLCGWKKCRTNQRCRRDVDGWCDAEYSCVS